jgi:transketolase
MTLDIRDAFFQEISNYALSDPDFIIITNDMEAFALEEFKSKHPDRFINSGVAEQNMVNVAAGLASAGKKVLIFGILSFISTRCFEQIKLNICGMNLPIIIVGIGPGLSFSFDGPTHHATNDITIMRQLPELRILNPSDEVNALTSAKIALDFSSPTYVRLDKGQFPVINSKYISQENYSSGLVEIATGPQKLVLFTGTVLEKAQLIHDQTQKNVEGTGLICVIQIKPVPIKLISILSNAKEITVVEENSLSGGLFSIISETISANGFDVKVKFALLKNDQAFKYGDRKWITEKMETNSETISY